LTITRRLLAMARPTGRIAVRSAALLVELTGFGVLCGGLWLVWPPIAVIVGGIILVVLAQGVRIDAAR